MTVLISGGSPRRAKALGAPWSGKGVTTYLGPWAGRVGLWGGRSVTYEYMLYSQPWVYAAVRTFYLALGRLPQKVHGGLESGQRRQLRDHELARLLREPFPLGSAFGLKAERARNLFTHGNALEWKVRPGPGRAPVELWPVPWPMVQQVCQGEDIQHYKVYTGFGEPKTLQPSEVVHYRLMGGRSPLEPLRRTLAIEDAAIEWLVSALENGPAVRGVFSTDKVLQDRTLPRLRSELKEMYAGPEGDPIGLFDQGLKFQSVEQKAGDAGILETRKATREEAAATYGIPAPMIGILDHATYSNITDLRRSFYVDTVAPYCTLVEETQQTQLIDSEPTWKRDDVFTEFEFGEVLKPDPLAEAQSISQLTNSGTTSTNDNRKLKRLDPIGDPDDPDNPYNRPRVPANLIDPMAPADPAQAAALLAALLVGGAQAGTTE